MLWSLDTSTLLIIVSAVAGTSFILGLILDAILGDDGFGPTGNSLVAAAGFFLAVYAAAVYGFRLGDLAISTGIGLAGAFSCVGVLAVLKHAFNRF
jgi:hypothetical protein